MSTEDRRNAATCNADRADLVTGEAPIRFACPGCNAQHDRGYLNGVDLFRCLGCGYVGHGHHPDAEADRAIHLDIAAANEVNRSLGLPEDWTP